MKVIGLLARRGVSARAGERKILWQEICGQFPAVVTLAIQVIPDIRVTPDILDIQAGLAAEVTLVTLAITPVFLGFPAFLAVVGAVAVGLVAAVGVVVGAADQDTIRVTVMARMAALHFPGMALLP